MATITLGITGGIAAYKIPDLIRQFRKQGIAVNCIATESALRFVTAETLAVVSESEVILPGNNSINGHIAHLDARRSSDLFIVAPATANFIAKAAAGIADSPLLSAFLAFAGPKVIAPAMHDTMWLSPATQRNVTQLKEWGIEFVGPDVGNLASGDFGPGRMVDLDLIVMKAQLVMLGAPRLDGFKAVVTVGGTREAIDPVRMITNLSTGKLGSALAHALGLQGATVSVVTTVPFASNPHIAAVIPVVSTNDMQSALSEVWPTHDLLLMPAAVSDFKPTSHNPDKLKRSAQMTVELEPTTDILGGLPRLPHQKVIGFCLESPERLRESAIKKLRDKRLDAIVANTPNQFGLDQRDFWIITEANETEYKGVSLAETATTLVKLSHNILIP